MKDEGDDGEGRGIQVKTGGAKDDREPTFSMHHYVRFPFPSV